MNARRKNRRRFHKKTASRQFRPAPLNCERLEDRRLLDGAGLLPHPGDLVDEAHPNPFGPNAAPVEMHGLKWADLNGNGQREDGEPGRGGVTIYADLNFNGQLDDNEPRALTSLGLADGPVGRYHLENLRPGLHIIREVVPEGFEQTFPNFDFPMPFEPFPIDDGQWQVIAPPSDGQSHVLFLESGDAAEGIDFGNFKFEAGAVVGRKWEDLNRDGQRNDDEPGLDGVTIFSDLNYNGRLDPHEPHTMTAEDDPDTRFDESGRYELPNLQVGYHMIREVVPEGFEQTFPSLPPGHRPPPWGDASVHVVVVETDGVVENVDFGNYRLPLGSVHGVKWEDLNGNAVRDENEPGLAGVKIYSDVNQNGAFDRDEPHTVTMRDDPNTDFDEAGRYWLEDLAPGNHWIREIVPDGFQQTFPNSFFLFDWQFDPAIGIPFPWPGNDAHDVFVRPGEAVESVDFGNQRILPGSIHGTKWHDLDGDGQRDPNEPGLAGVTIYVDANHNGMLDDDEPHTRTMRDDPNTDFDEAGRYWLEGLRPGQHSVREVVPEGFRQTFPLGPFPLPFPVPVDPPLFDHDGQHDVGDASQLDIFVPGGAHWVWLGSGETVEGIDFGNQSREPGSIHGVKWSDRNGNGEHDADEPGLPGVVIYVDANNNGRLDPHERSTETRADDPATDFDEAGHYWLEEVEAGMHLVREVVPDGFRQTFPLPTDGSLPPDGQWPEESHPDVRVDEYSTVSPDRIDVILEPGEPFHTEVSLTLHPFFFRSFLIDVISSDPDVELINLTGPQENGGGGQTSTFEIMIFGTGERQSFEIQFIDAEFGGVQASIPVTINGGVPPKSAAHRVQVRPGQAVEGVDFGNQRLARSSVHGQKWLDRDGDGQRDSDEPGLGGVVIYSDLNFNGVLDQGEPRTLSMEDNPETEFDETGLYWLDGLGSGRHWIAEVVPEGFVQTFPNDPVIEIFPPPPGAGRIHEVFLEPGQGSDGIDFGNRRAEPGVVAGRTWSDRNGDGRQNGNERGLGGVVIYADLNFNGQLDFGEPETISADDDPSTDFDEGGLYELRTRAGFQAIREIVPDGHFQTFPISDAASPFEQGAHFVTVEPGGFIGGLDFGNQALDSFPAFVHGTKWLDRNGNGQRDAEEPGLGGVVIYSDLNFNGVLDGDEPHTRTSEDIPETDFDEAGLYWLEVPFGQNWIREVVPEGWVQTFPLSIAAFPGNGLLDAYMLDLAPGESIDGIDFGNRPLDVFVGDPMAADFDDDGAITGHDFLRWQRGHGTPEAAATHGDGDADHDHDVDGEDLDVWEATFGTTLPQALPSQSSAAPETLVGVAAGETVGAVRTISAELADAAILRNFTEQFSIGERALAPVRSALQGASTATRPDYAAPPRTTSLGEAAPGSRASLIDADWELQLDKAGDQEFASALDEVFAELV